jgi:hypothetical protein
LLPDRGVFWRLTENLWGNKMPKFKANAEEIRQEIQRRIQTSLELDGDCKECKAPTPRFTNPNEIEGCNWTVDIFPGVVPGCMDFVKAITRSVMAEYELIG